MDSVSSLATPDHRRLSPPPLPSSETDRFPQEDTPPPPPRHPLPRGRSDTDGHSPSRRCPPPPLPAREPLGRSRNAGEVVRPTTTTTALDSVVPLSHWPLRSAGLQPTAEKHSSTHLTLDDCSRRAAAALPVNMMVVSSTSTVSRPSAPTVASQQQPKTGCVGRGNLYVDSPTAAVAGGGGGCTQQQVTTVDRPPRSSDCPRGTPHHQASSPTVKFNAVVQSNGGPAGSEKAGVVSGQPRSLDARVCRGGIMCHRCGRCRCANCTAPRELPRRWIGDWECSVQRCVSVTSCLCCVEALFYHCLDGADADDGAGGGGAADDPCACCERPRCCVRWTLMAGLATTVLPCLCCYCPLQCAAAALTSCYNACAAPRGCRCRGSATHEASSGSSTRGLLAESESSST